GLAWLQDNLGLVILALLALLLLFVLLTALAAVTQAALIRASAEHDAERPFSLGPALSFGVSAFGRMFGLKLLGLAYGLLVLAVFIGLAAAGIGSYLAGNYAGVGAAVVIGVAVGLLLIPIAIVLDVVLRLAARAVALDGLGPLRGLAAGFRLLGRRLGRIALTWLIYVGISLAAGLVVALLLIVAALPLAGLVFAGYLAAHVPGLVVTSILAGLTFLAVTLLVAGAGNAYFSTYWTLAYRRFDLEPMPAAVAA
ncbi:MAG TPA: hypothetical protein VK131_00175, partial [Candidatus Acidoferrales bacterium]|nr:hypothetical protein [Candidatus Acidoferrales bacterium]